MEVRLYSTLSEGFHTGHAHKLVLALSEQTDQGIDQKIVHVYLSVSQEAFFETLFLLLSVFVFLHVPAGKAETAPYIVHYKSSNRVPFQTTDSLL